MSPTLHKVFGGLFLFSAVLAASNHHIIRLGLYLALAVFFLFLGFGGSEAQLTKAADEAVKKVEALDPQDAAKVEAVAATVIKDVNAVEATVASAESVVSDLKKV